MLNTLKRLFEGKKLIWLFLFGLPFLATGQDQVNISYEAKSVTTSDYRNVSGFENMGVIVSEELKSYKIRLRNDNVYEVTIQKQNPTGADGEIVTTKFEGAKMYLYNASGEVIFEDDFKSEMSGTSGAVNIDILQLSQEAVLSYLKEVASESLEKSKGLVKVNIGSDQELSFDATSGVLVAESNYSNGQVVSDTFYKSSRKDDQFVLEGIDKTVFLGSDQPKVHITTQIMNYEAQFEKGADISKISKN
jgi:hypothetical protein